MPYTRGAEASRPAPAIAGRGARGWWRAGRGEIALLGQNVNAWHGEGPDGRPWSLARLIRALAEIPGLARLRYTTSHPRDMDDDLIAAHGEVPTLMPFLHLPVQSGSDRVLAAMNRGTRPIDYLRLVERLRAARPGHRAVVRFHRRPSRRDRRGFRGDAARWCARSASPRPTASNTRRAPARPAAGLPQVPEAEKDRRLHELQALLREQQAAFNAACVGLALPVLFTGPGRHPGQVAGRSPYLQPVHLSGPATLIGEQRTGADRRRAPQFLVRKPRRGGGRWPPLESEEQHHA